MNRRSACRHPRSLTAAWSSGNNGASLCRIRHSFMPPNRSQEAMPLVDVGTRRGVSAERCRRIQNIALRKLGVMKPTVLRSSSVAGESTGSSGSDGDTS